MKLFLACLSLLASVAIIAAVTAPKEAPKGVDADPGPGSLVISWTPVPDSGNGGAPILSYQAVAWTSETQGQCWSDGDEDTCTIHDLVPRVRHSVEVRAWNVMGPGPWSSTVYATPNDLPSIEGEIVFARDYQRDSDTPDRDDASNDTMEEAHSTKRGKTVIGHASEDDDADDWYRIKPGGERVDLVLWTEPVSNYSDTAKADLDLYVYDEDGNLERASLGDHTIFEETWTYTYSDIRYIRVNAFSGESNYTLYVDTFTDSHTGHPSPFAHQWTTETEFIPAEAIIEMVQQDGLPPTLRVKELEASGTFSVKAGAPDREMLVFIPSHALDPAQAKADTLLGIKRLRRERGIENVELNHLVEAAEIPNDTYYEQYQWHLEQISLPDAWDEEKGSDDIVIAVVDQGYLDHPDLDDRYLTRDDGSVDGYDFVSNIISAWDGDGIDDDPWEATYWTHGIRVAGIIGAETDNDQGVAGVTWEGKILPVRVLGFLGGSYYDTLQGIRYAAGLDNDSGEVRDQPAHVINLSLGFSNPQCFPWERSRSFDALVEEVLEQGSLIVKSAGNDSCRHVDPRDQNEDVLTVSATTINDGLASYSNYGEDIDIAAPGGEWGSYQNDPDYSDVPFTTRGKWEDGEFVYVYGGFNGTSAAAPHVSGVAALMFAANEDLTPYDVLRLVRGIHEDENADDITDDIGEEGWDEEFGHGLINAEKAVDVAKDIVGGSGPIEEPRLHLDTRFLFYPLGVSTRSIRVSNIGSGGDELEIEGFRGTRHIESVVQDEDDPDVFHVTIDRSEFLRESQVRLARVLAESNGGNVSFMAVVLTKSRTADPDAGPVWVTAVNMETGKRYGALLESGDETEYRIHDIPVGDYRVFAGTDMDNDGRTLYDVGEVTGEYFLDGIRFVTVRADEVMESVDFLVNLEAFYR